MSICQCPNCTLIYPNPLPVPNHIEDHYGVPAETYWTEKYFEIDPTYFSHHIETASKLLSQKSQIKALDIGAGIGKSMYAMTTAGFDTYGIEPSPQFREKAISRTGIPKDKLQLASIEDAVFDANFFDFITFGAVLEHLVDPSDSIEKAVSWLRPGGLIQIEVPSSAYLIHRILNILYRLLGTNFVGNLSPMHTPYHLYEFGLKSFEEHGIKTGYTVVSSDITPASSRFLPSIIYPLIERWMERTNTGMQLTVWLRKND